MLSLRKMLVVVLTGWLIGCAQHRDESYVMLVSNLGAGEILEFASDGAFLGHLVLEDRLPEDAIEDRFAPSDVVVLGDEMVVSNFATGQLVVLDRTTGAFLREFSPGFGVDPSGQFVEIEEPCQMLWNGEQVMVLGNDSKNVLGWNAEADLEVSIGGRGVMGAGHGFALTDDGQLIVAISPLHPWSGLLQLWDTRTGEKLADFGAYGELLEGTDIISIGDGRILVADWFGQQIVEYDLETRRKVASWTSGRFGNGPACIPNAGSQWRGTGARRPRAVALGPKNRGSRASCRRPADGLSLGSKCNGRYTLELGADA